MNRRQLLIGGGVSAVALTMTNTRLLHAQEASPIPSTAQEFELPGDAVYPEGVAYDADSGLFYTGSTNDGTIFQGDLASGEVTVFSQGDADRPGAYGMKVDAAGHLIVAGGPAGKVYVLDTANGSAVASFSNGMDATFVNDIAVAPNGDVYATDSINPVLYRISADNIEAGGDLESFVDFTGTPFEYGEPGSFNANGIVVTDDGAHAVMVHTGTGQLFRVELASGDVMEITINGEPVVNGDGLALDGQTLYVLRNQAALIVRLELDEAIETATEIDAFTDASFAFPTTLALVDSTRALVVNSQFDKRDAGNPDLPFTISLINIPPLGNEGTPVATPLA